MDELKRIKWQCRRGMLELDVLLERFVDNKYRGLSESDKSLFDELLSENDQDLFMWFTAKAAPLDKYGKLVEQIRSYR